MAEEVVNEKIRKMGTNVITKAEEYLFIEKRLSEIYPQKILTLYPAYKSSRDGDDSESFHTKCDDIVGSVVLIKSGEDLVFGGYTKEKWKGDCVFKTDNTAFLFSFNPWKIYNIKKVKNAIFCSKNYGPCFGSITLAVNNNFNDNGGWCCSSILSCFDGYDTDYHLSKGENQFKILELEVYAVFVN